MCGSRSIRKYGACGDCGVATKERCLEILDFREGNEESSEEARACKARVYAKLDNCPRCENFLGILTFTQFFDHFVFTPNEENVLEKELKKKIPVSVGIELVVVDMSRNA